MNVQSTANVMTLQFSSRSENEAFARIAVAAFFTQLNPTMDELTDLKTVISEAVTNCIIHGYDNDPTGIITITAELTTEGICMTVADKGKGIEDIELARQPLYTSKPEMERSGMGFTIMENFMDTCTVTTELGVGTSICLKKRVEVKKALYN